jgi:hypothetical protein
MKTMKCGRQRCQRSGPGSDGRLGYVVRWAGLVFLLSGLVSSPAVLFYSTGAPDHNTNAPAGDLEGSGWQYQGQWYAFLGTPIAPHYFITAKHVGGAPEAAFVLDGQSYLTTACFDDPNGDLRIWRVASAFPRLALLYDRSDEVGQPLVVFGRGTQRGEPVLRPGLPETQLQGWLWGPGDGVQRWGQNEVDSIETNAVDNPNLLKMLFRRDGGTNEATLSGGDSGGGLFIKSGSVWKLAGINYAVNGPYNFTNTGDGFNACLFDEGELYGLTETNTWELIPATPGMPQPGAFYATRISARLDWINQVLSQPTPGPLLFSAPQVNGPYAQDPTALVQPNAQSVTVPQPMSIGFWRIQDRVVRTIKGIKVNGGTLVIAFE